MSTLTTKDHPHQDVSSAALGEFVLRVSGGPYRGDDITVRDRKLSIGSREDCEVVLDHASVYPEEIDQIFEYVRQGRAWTGYQGLSVSGIDVLFENVMDGTALITSNAGWKWTDAEFRSNNPRRNLSV